MIFKIYIKQLDSLKKILNATWKFKLPIMVARYEQHHNPRENKSSKMVDFPLKNVLHLFLPPQEQFFNCLAP